MDILEIILNILNGLILIRLSNKFSLYHPAKIWMILQFIFYLGTIYLTDFQSEIEISHLRLYSLFILVTNITCIFLKPEKKVLALTVGENTLTFITRTFYISLAMCYLYYTLSGGNLFYTSLKNIFNLNPASIVNSSRLEYYAGENYYAPGFFNFFKNFLLPSSFYSILFLHVKGFKKRSRLFLITAFTLYILFILGTGQRGALIQSLVYLILFSFYFMGMKKTKKILIRFGFFFFLIFLLSTFFLGRTGLVSLNNFEDFVLLFKSATDRFLIINQKAGLYGYKYIIKYEELQWGRDWFMSLEQFLPGKSTHTNLSNKVFAYLYGSTRGTTPPSLMVSVYYNFGIIGVALFPIFYLIILDRIHLYFIESYKNFLDVFVYSFAYLAICFWVTSALDFPLRNGILLFILMFIFKKMRTLSKKSLSYAPPQ